MVTESSREVGNPFPPAKASAIEIDGVLTM
jgi:hypothetical protein